MNWKYVKKLKNFKFGKKEFRNLFANARREALMYILTTIRSNHRSRKITNRSSKSFGNEENWIVLPTIFGGVLVWLEVTFTLITDPVSSSSSSLILRGSLGFPSRKAKCLDKIEATCESPVIRWNCLLKRNYEKKSLIWREIYVSFLFPNSRLLLLFSSRLN